MKIFLEAVQIASIHSRKYDSANCNRTRGRSVSPASGRGIQIQKELDYPNQTVVRGGRSI